MRGCSITTAQRALLSYVVARSPVLLALPAFVWVEVEATAVEVDCRLEVLAGRSTNGQPELRRETVDELRPRKARPSKAFDTLFSSTATQILLVTFTIPLGHLRITKELVKQASVDTPNPAIDGQGKTGQRSGRSRPNVL